MTNNKIMADIKRSETASICNALSHTSAHFSYTRPGQNAISNRLSRIMAPLMALIKAVGRGADYNGLNNRGTAYGSDPCLERMKQNGRATKSNDDVISLFGMAF